jgi:predicted AlkP superfamily pyrophosphatase or phosphodiesterase
MKHIYFFLILSLCWENSFAQKTSGSFSNPAKPKLVVGIIVDQMRYDYLYKYYNKYSENGFKKLLAQGFNCKNTNYNYVPTYTGPGHAAVYTGTTPAVNGIVSNIWYVRQTGKNIYVTDDDTAHTVGSNSAAVGKMSPRNMLTYTVSDELRLYSNMRSRVISVALKDRSAILPGGFLSNGSYWFDSGSGNFVTSTFYMNELPQWVKDFNALQLPKKYLSQPWNTLLPIAQYTESAPDDNPYEGLMKGETNPVFPHNLPSMFTATDYDVLRWTPFGNSITKDLALAAMKGENLGKGNFTDFLCISFSSTDYVGHTSGPQSIELEDTYLRLDADIAELLTYLEKTYGKDGFLLFLTADHAAQYVPAQLMDLKIPAGYYSDAMFSDSLKNYAKKKFGDTAFISAVINEQVYLNHSLLRQKNISLKEMEDDVAQYVLHFNGVANAYTAFQLNGDRLQSRSAQLIQNGFCIKRSGDVAILFEPSWMEWQHTGTTHGSSYPYDTHVPLLWYGWKIKPGSTADAIDITDVAPTVSSLLNIMFPDGCTGKPIAEIVK